MITLAHASLLTQLKSFDDDVNLFERWLFARLGRVKTNSLKSMWMVSRPPLLSLSLNMWREVINCLSSCSLRRFSLTFYRKFCHGIIQFLQFRLKINKISIFNWFCIHHLSKILEEKVFFGSRSATAILDRGSQVNIKQHMQFNDSRIYLLVCRSS